MDVLIRKAHGDELNIIQDLNYALFLSDYDKDPDLNLNWPYEDGEEYFRAMISGEKGVCFVAELDNKIIGYLAGSIKIDQPSYRPIQRSELENMFVLEEYRSNGVGKKLVDEFLAWSLSNGINRSFVSTYYLNSRAFEFYKRASFEPYSNDLEAKLG